MGRGASHHVCLHLVFSSRLVLESLFICCIDQSNDYWNAGIMCDINGLVMHQYVCLVSVSLAAMQSLYY